MKALRLKGAKNIVLEEIPVPDISENEVLVEVKYLESTSAQLSEDLSSLLTTGQTSGCVCSQRKWDSARP